MTMRIILGRPGLDGVSPRTQVYEEIKEATLAGKGGLILLVPEQYTLGAEQALMAHLNKPGLMGIEVLSLGRLATRVFQEVGGIIRTVVDDHGRRMLLAKSLGKVRSGLTLYKKSASRPGFLGELAAFIGELKQNRINGEALEAAAQGLEENSLLRQKLRDMATLYESYEGELGTERWDEDTRADMLCERIPQSDQLQGATVWIDGFFTFSTSDFAIIEALAGQVKGLTMSLVGDIDPLAPDASIFSICRATCETMAAIAKGSGQEFQVISLSKEGPKTPLSYLEGQLYAYCPKPWTGPVSGIKIFQAANPWEEARGAAQEILTLVRDGGYSYKDIAILCGDPGTQGGMIARALSAYGVPSFRDEAVAVSENPLIEGLLSALEAVERRYYGDALMAYAKSGFAGVDPEACNPLENYALAWGIKGGKWRVPFTQGGDSWNLEDLNRGRETLMGPLMNLQEAMDGVETYRSRLTATVAFLEEIQAPQTLSSLGEALAEKGNYEAQSHFHQIWNVLMEVLEQIEGAMGDETCNLQEYRRILESGLATYTIGVLPTRRDVVTITDAFRSRGGKVKALLVLGANEGLLPAEDNHYTLLTESDRRRLAEAGITLQDNPSYRRSREDYAIYTQLTRATESLYLSYTLCDEEGQSQLPSSLVRGLRSVFPSLSVMGGTPGEDDLKWLAGSQGTLEELGRRLAEGRTPALCALAQGYYREDSHWNAAYHQMERALEYRGVGDTLPVELVSAVYGTPVKTSISRLEQYRSCPFAHFIHYGLQPRPRAEYIVTPPDIGTLLHSVIDGVFKRAAGAGLALSELDGDTRNHWVEAELENQIPQMAGQVFESTGAYRFLGKKLKRVGIQTVRMLAEHLGQGDFTFKYSEHHFTQPVDSPALPKGTSVRGVVDRIDTYTKDGETFIKVIDYKTGAKAINLAEVYYGISLQLLVYMDAGMALASQEERETLCLPGGTFYFHVDDPMVSGEGLTGEDLQRELDKKFKMKGIFLDDPRVIAALDVENAKSSAIFEKGSALSRFNIEEFGDLLRYIEAIIEESLVNILGGDITIAPYKMGNQTACDYCEYKSICQFDESLERCAYRVLREKITKELLLEEAREDRDEVD